MNTSQVDGLVVQRPQTTPSAPGHPSHQTWQCVISSCGVSSRTMFTFHRIQKHCQNCESASTPQSGTSHKACLGGFGGNGSIVWTSAVSHVGRTSNAFKVTMKLQTFLFQIVVTSCISVQYLWKYGFAKSSDNLYAPCIILRITVLAGKQKLFQMVNTVSIFMEPHTTCQCSQHTATDPYYRREGPSSYHFNTLFPSASRSLKFYFFFRTDMCNLHRWIFMPHKSHLPSFNH